MYSPLRSPVLRVTAVLLLALASRAIRGEIRDAANRSDPTGVSARLARNPGIVSTRDNDGAAPLPREAQSVRKKPAELLLATAAAVDAREQNGAIPVFSAGGNDHPEMTVRGARFTVRSVRFYESPQDANIPVAIRIYTARFPSQGTRYVVWELNLQHAELAEPISFFVETVWYNPTGQVWARQSTEVHYQTKAENFLVVSGWGNTGGGAYSVTGKYRVEFSVEKNPIAAGDFEVYSGQRLRFFESGPDSAGQRVYFERFPSGHTRYVNWETTFQHGRLPEPTSFQVDAVWYKPDGKVWTNQVRQVSYTKKVEDFLFADGWGSASADAYSLPGMYRVELFAENKLIGSGAFEVYRFGPIGSVVVLPPVDFRSDPSAKVDFKSMQQVTLEILTRTNHFTATQSDSAGEVGEITQKDLSSSKPDWVRRLGPPDSRWVMVTGIDTMPGGRLTSAATVFGILFDKTSGTVVWQGRGGGQYTPSPLPPGTAPLSLQAASAPLADLMSRAIFAGTNRAVIIDNALANLLNGPKGLPILPNLNPPEPKKKKK
jgi:hypothetical protein